MTWPTYRPFGVSDPRMYSSVLTSNMLRSWSVPTNVPIKTRSSEVTMRRVSLSSSLTAAIAGVSMHGSGEAIGHMSVTRHSPSHHRGLQ